ncbi:restriction endonuclease subunit S [Escherichia coli]|uniref:Restriction endonuclease subunit S n=3 Tax=Escherichia coli TaxID=562 RepID=A0A797HZT4_ECOLX|nr:restriction endonuclease subunit S [Escherichia coli]EFB2602001.1 restriction endonuclease subunit S [Escherichia coli]EFH4865887.1 restriction endonuclease subunit S [Escherichia coli]EFU9145424.1 restriction endonuclease subunit S [Escherichia coli]EGK2930001.1 restriction endonuclease subunit S [Escherichia coli]EHA7811275.1 restriction endonuclease subunit S [Escherichia coli]
MSELSYLEKLLDGIEVEWVPVSELFQIKNGYTPSKSKKEFWENGTIPWFRLEDVRVNGRELNDSIQHINPLGVKGFLFPKNSIFMSTTATIGEYALVRVPYLTNQQITNFSISEKFSEAVNIKYIFYRFYDFGKWCTENANKSGGVSIIGLKKLSQYQFPIPCPDNPEKSLAIQSEIVRILDKFTALTAELTAELNMRKKQYNYYRDQLLSFDEEQEKPIYLEKLLDGVEVEWRTLGEIAVIYDGTHKTPKYTASGVPFVSVQNIKNLYGTNKYISPEDFKTYKNKPRKHDLFMTRIGDVGTCAIVEDDRPLAYYVTLALIRINQQIAVPGFIRYLIESRFGKAELYKRTLIHAVPMKINLGEIGKVAVPIPCPDNPEKSLAIQSEIVRILDKFDTLTNSITEGLPREIELRQKQYEYYRNLLFSFPKPETVSN